MIIQVWDPPNETYIDDLEQPYGISAFLDKDAPGMVQFTVDVASQADIALLLPRRSVRFVTVAGDDPYDPGTVLATAVVQDTPAVLDTDPATGQVLSSVTFECPDSLSWLGYEQGGGVLEPAGSGTGATVSGRMLDPRDFGPMHPDFDDSAWAEPATDGPLTTPGWPVPRAEAFIFFKTGAFRRVLTAIPSADGMQSIMIAAATYSTSFTIWLDGEEILAKEAGTSGVFYYKLEYDASYDHLLYIRADDPGWGRLGWAWHTGTGRTDEYAPDATPVAEQVLFRSFNTATTEGTPTLPVWTGLTNFDDEPGVNPGFVMDVGLEECHDRGELAWVDGSFTRTVDSNGDPWEREVAHSFRIQKLGGVLSELLDWHCEPHMDPETNTLHLYNRRGTDRSADITITAPHSLSLTGRGIQATRLFYKTPDGFGRAVNADAETELGTVMVDVAEFGTARNPRALKQLVVERLQLDGRMASEIQVGFPDDVVPLHDVFLGDSVIATAGIDGSSGKVRLTSFSLDITTSGVLVWTGTAVSEVDL